ncbi:DUF5796 family protein [Halospeciosus flavus]|uniref:DUF5796 family protein n=1 Tax=Halospeciosus flavus TaxID=3032283 RepID=A0ABD5Z1V2_9EURY|nr:DUF5796 family protein [Halospeciosus flavus]
MSARSDIAPSTLSVELDEGGIYVEYHDGRRVFYNGVPQKVEGTLRTKPGKHVQVLVTDESGTEGVLLYINDRKTADEILEDSGVGRVVLEPGETSEVFPGVEVELDGYAVEVTADPDVARGRVFVFEEDDMGERSYELFAADGDDE